MEIFSVEKLEGRNYEYLGLVEGGSIQAINVGKDILSGLKNLIGGELDFYNEMMTKSKDLAKVRMIKKAQEIGADAIIGVRYYSSSITSGASEIAVYGTAIKYLD